LVIKDLDGKEVPNLVNLDNKADQDPDVKKWVADLEQHVKTIKAERIGRLKQFVEDAEISIDFENSPEIYNDLKEQINQYNQDIQQIKKKLETDPDNVSDDAVENCLSRKRYIEDLI
jgi:DNA-binding SARP family transcriptional activator